MALAKVFKNHVPNCKVFTPTGVQIVFHHGKCITQFKHEIEYLQSLVDAGDPYVYVDPEESEVDTDELTAEGRMAKLKREAVEEYLAKVTNTPPSIGDTPEGAGNKLGMGTSATLLNAIASNSNAPKVAAPTAPAGEVKVIETGIKVEAPAPAAPK